MAPNVLFVLLDGSRTDRLHISKDFLKLQNEGMLFNNITAAYPYTFPAINAIFTGVFGKENGVNAYYNMFKLKDSISFLPEILQKNGYFTSCDLISDKVISKRGFDIYQSHDEYVDDLTIRHPEFIKDTFNKANGKPIFTFLQFSRIHTVTVSEILKKYEWDDKMFYENKQENLAKYDKVFLEACNYAIKIKQTISELGKSEETAIVFFSDHGTGIGERFGERNYGVFTYEETLRTHHLFIGPNIQKGKICDKLFSSTRIFHTLLDICEVESEEVNQEKSLKNYLLGYSKEVNGDEYTFSET